MFMHENKLLQNNDSANFNVPTEWFILPNTVNMEMEIAL